jgi:RNA recognition motif
LLSSSFFFFFFFFSFVSIYFQVSILYIFTFCSFLIYLFIPFSVSHTLFVISKFLFLFLFATQHHVIMASEIPTTIEPTATATAVDTSTTVTTPAAPASIEAESTPPVENTPPVETAPLADTPAGDPQADNKAPAGTPTKLFVGQVPQTTPEDEIRRIFSEHGQVLDIFIIRNKVTGRPDGCLFVTLHSAEAAEAARTALNEQITLPGVCMVV